MAKFNKKGITPTKTVNKAGGEAYKQSDKLEFVSMLLTSFLGDQHYRSGDETMDRIVELVGKLPPEFCAKAALYARNEFGMRSVSHVVAAEIGRIKMDVEWKRRFFKAIVHRPDDMLEIAAYFGNKYGKPFPMAMRRGFADVLSTLDAHKLAKYRSPKADVSMVDMVNLVHPKHTEAIGQLVEGTLAPAETWETKLTQAGQNAGGAEEKAEMKKDAWESLLKENKLGYMALMRNCRNILNQAPECVDLLCEQLVNEEAIKKSLVLPFRFTTAIGQLEKEPGSQKILKALSKATDIALSNVPKFDGDTCVVLDDSGSMSGQPIDIGSLFAAVLVKANGADFMRFSNHASYLTLNSDDSVTSLRQRIMDSIVSGGTNFHSIFNTLARSYKRIIILSDMQGWVGYTAPKAEFDAYKKRFNADPFIYSFDLQGYGTMQFPESKVFAIAGWSEKIFEVMKLLEGDRNALIEKIESISL